ncbi:hypothetical protein [Isobaculum melis]|uniref:Uncharacterized protein n=1 Tax=Isobaculum melis TaxID=142588 RepID=A0A1H9TIX9_9LACT|nr:hypothetical protein [Isobaculum melis]SER97155.1 hypothetical protein SAMN04488559_1143 [Isobaculum melis]
MMNILAFNDAVVAKYGHFAQVMLEVTIEEKNIVITAPISFLSDYSGMSLSILWEKSGIDNYQAIGLQDLYYTTHDNMTYDSNEQTLTVIDPNGMVLKVKA